MKACGAVLHLLVAWYLIVAIHVAAQSPLRPDHHLKPTLVTYYDFGAGETNLPPSEIALDALLDPALTRKRPAINPPKKFVSRSEYYERWAHFTRYDETYLKAHELPDGPIPPRGAGGTPISGNLIKNRINRAVDQIFKVRRRVPFKGIKILKDRDWNYPRSSGLIIFELEDVPFVIKLYRETPQSYVSPLSKGIEPALFSVMSGGINRYQLGFTRIKNGITVQEMLKEHPLWKTQVTLPREWYWVPDNTLYFIIEGYNMGCDQKCTIRVPTMYAIVCDKIEQERSFSMNNAEDRRTAMDITRYLKNRIDPNIKNFIIEKETGKIAIIDTEHFASVVGLKEPIEFRNYWNWYTRLAGEFLKRGFATTLPQRQRIREDEIPELLRV